jgi:hypothetical protein
MALEYGKMHDVEPISADMLHTVAFAAGDCKKAGDVKYDIYRVMSTFKDAFSRKWS